MSSGLEVKDLAQKSHWDSIYSNVEFVTKPSWEPRSYEEISLENMLLREIDRFSPESILEVGCGNSVWLPYLAKKRKLKVFGLDYSEEGCQLARRRLNAENVEGTVYCGDLLNLNHEEIGQFDFVYSLGVVEHFSDLEEVLPHLLKFVNSGGVLLTEVPNLFSVHGIMSFLYQPELLRKHRILKKNDILSAYRKTGLEEIGCSYVGIFSVGITAWGMYQRFPSLDRVLLPVIHKLARNINALLISVGKYNGCFACAPFLYAVGKKSR
jgi:2-polyprenyl-3-methyl-5-hydroxy-6-metoxy-1,4-benzoquinol methylase